MTLTKVNWNVLEISRNFWNKLFFNFWNLRSEINVTLWNVKWPEEFFLLIFSTQSQKIQNNVRNLHWSFLTLFGNVIKVTSNYTHRMTENDK